MILNCLTMETELLHLSVRQPTDEDLLNCPFISLTSDDAWRTQSLHENKLEGSFWQHKVFKISTLVGRKEKVDLKSFFCTFRNLQLLELQMKQLTPEQVDHMNPYLRWHPLK